MKIIVFYIDMNEQQPKQPSGRNNVYIGPAVMAGMAVMDLAGLAVAEAFGDVPDAYSDTMLTTGGYLLAGAALGAVAAVIINRR